ncbi:MAG: hypothetical protein M3Z24_05545 [Chloroflexota bacterium]|nr:hypothetical protein [Chloroflexota bacterium]
MTERSYGRAGPVASASHRWGSESCESLDGRHDGVEQSIRGRKVVVEANAATGRDESAPTHTVPP